jgi:Transcriptional regulator PadR-like family
LTNQPELENALSIGNPIVFLSALLDGIAERVYSPFQNRRALGRYNRLAARCPGNAHSQGLVSGASPERFRGASGAPAWVRNPAPYSTDIRGTMRDPGEILERSFCNAIYRLERRGWIRGEWGESENNRRANFYRLTNSGKRQLKEEIENWTDLASVVASILQAKAERA